MATPTVPSAGLGFSALFERQDCALGDQILDLLLVKGLIVDAEVIQRADIVGIRRIFRPAEPVLGCVTEMTRQSLCRGCGNDIAIQEKLHAHAGGVDRYGDMVPACRQPVASSQLRLGPVAADGDGEPHLARVAAADGRGQKHVHGLARAEVEDTLPGPALLGVIGPDGKCRVGQLAQERANGQVDVVIRAVEPNAALDLPGDPGWAIRQGAIILVEGQVGRRRAGVLIEGPPADGRQGRSGRPYRTQNQKRPNQTHPFLTHHVSPLAR